MNDELALRAIIAGDPSDFIYWLEGEFYDYDLLTKILDVTNSDNLKTPADKYSRILDVIEIYVGRYVERGVPIAPEFNPQRSKHK